MCILSPAYIYKYLQLSKKSMFFRKKLKKNAYLIKKGIKLIGDE